MRAGYHPDGKPKSAKTKDVPGLKEQGFYHTPAWRRARLLALQRDRYLCKLHLSKKCTKIATEVHHIQALDDHPELALELSNLISCCWQCHEETKPRGRKIKLPPKVRVIVVSDGSENERNA